MNDEVHISDRCRSTSADSRAARSRSARPGFRRCRAAILCAHGVLWSGWSEAGMGLRVLRGHVLPAPVYRYTLGGVIRTGANGLHLDDAGGARSPDRGCPSGAGAGESRAAAVASLRPASTAGVWENCFGLAHCGDSPAITLLLASMYGLRVFAFGHLALHGVRIVKFAAFWGIFFLLVGLFEDFLFRGYTQFTLTRIIGFWPAAFLLSCTLRLDPSAEWRRAVGRIAGRGGDRFLLLFDAAAHRAAYGLPSDFTRPGIGARRSSIPFPTAERFSPAIC